MTLIWAMIEAADENRAALDICEKLLYSHSSDVALDDMRKLHRLGIVGERLVEYFGQCGCSPMELHRRIETEQET